VCGVRKWCWLSTLLIFGAVGYVASYPVAYRLQNGPDVGPRMHNPCVVVDNWQENSWRVLTTYYYPPVEWMIDHTPVRIVVLKWAALWGVEEQLDTDSTVRDFLRIQWPQYTPRVPRRPGKINT
jgi:hypothetical protein